MADRWKAYWGNLKAFRLPEVIATTLGGIVVGVLGNATYDFLKDLYTRNTAAPHVVAASAPKATPPETSRTSVSGPEEGYEIDLAGRRVVLVTTAANIEPATAWALHAAFGTMKAPPYEFSNKQTVLRITQVYIRNLAESPDWDPRKPVPASTSGSAASAAGTCWNMQEVVISATLSVPSADPQVVSGKARMCSDHKTKALADFINQDVLPLAVTKLAQSIAR